MRLSYVKLGFLAIIAVFSLQAITFATEQSTSSWPRVTDHFILPPNGQKTNAFHMVVIGDSVAWGNGLNTEDKYYHLVADWLQNKLNKPVDVTVYAHSGASISISGESGKSINPSLNSGSPTLMDQANNIQNADDVDLILVSGGINDVDIMNILDVNIPVNEVSSHSESIKDSMKNLLINLLNNNKNAKIIVTSYYPIVSEDTKSDHLIWIYRVVQKIRSLDDKSKDLDNSALKKRLIENSDAFSSTSSASLASAVVQADNGANRIAFAKVIFESINSYAASETWLWKLFAPQLSMESSLEIFKTDDDQFEYRSPLSDDIINKINAMGHPNRDGAKEYARAIESAIESKGPNWLQNYAIASSEANAGSTNRNPPIVQAFMVTPLSLTAGESFTIDYTVSDKSGSGLKQAELWRTQEKDKWPEKPENPIQTKALASEDGPLSGSFTDSPSTPGKYWYGLHVVDNADNWNDEKNSNTNGQPNSFEPIEVEVKAAFPEIGQISEAHELQRLKHNVDVSSMAFSPDGAKLATIDGFSVYNYSGIARIWDVVTGAELQRMSLEDEMRSVIRSVFSKVIFSPDGKRIGTAGATTIQIWDVATGAELQRMNCGKEVISAAFSPDFTKVATANDDYRVRIWDVATGAELMELNPYTPETIAYHEVKPVVFSPDGSKVAVCHGGTVQIWDVSTGAEIQKMNDAGESVLFSPDSSKVVTTTSNPFANKFYVRIWDVTTGAELQRLNHEAPVGPVDFQQGGNKIVTECSSTALIWDVATGAELKRLDHSSPVGFVSFSPDGSKLATISYWNDTVRIWDATTGAEIQKLPQESDHLSNPSPTSILFSPDGSKMAVSVDDQTVRIWDITT